MAWHWSPRLTLVIAIAFAAFGLGGVALGACNLPRGSGELAVAPSHQVTLPALRSAHGAAHLPQPLHVPVLSHPRVRKFRGADITQAVWGLSHHTWAAIHPIAVAGLALPPAPVPPENLTLQCSRWMLLGRLADIPVLSFSPSSRLIPLEAHSPPVTDQA